MNRVSLEPISTSVLMSAVPGSASPSAGKHDPLVFAADGASKGYRGGRRLAAAQQIEREVDFIRPRLGGGIEQCDHKIAVRGGPQAPLHDRPRFQIVGQGDRTEIVAQRGAEARGRSLHRGDAGQHRDVEDAPRWFSRLDRFEYGGRHTEHAWVAAGDHHHTAAFRRHRQSLARPVEFDPVVAAMTLLTGPMRDAVKIRLVADDIGRGFKFGAHLRRDPFGWPWP